MAAPIIKAVSELKSQNRLKKQEEKEESKRKKQEEKEEAKRKKQEEKEEAKRKKQEEKEEAKRKKQEEKNQMKKNITKKAIERMVLTAIDVTNDHPNGFTCRELSNKYIEMHGNINPYTGNEIKEKYDIHAAIRGFMYESSPSSNQHWFKYGNKKMIEEVAPWIIFNKNLATINHKFDWKVSCKDLKKEQKNFKGKWMLLPHGPLTKYIWSDDIYGPLPTDQQLEISKLGRKKGFRKPNVDACVRVE